MGRLETVSPLDGVDSCVCARDWRPCFGGCTRLSAVEFQGLLVDPFSVFGSAVFDQAAEITTVLFQDGQLQLAGSSDPIPTSTIFEVSSTLRTAGTLPMAISRQFPRNSREACVPAYRANAANDPTCPTFPGAPQVSAHATPAHVAPAAAAAFTGFDYARASLECVPCEPSETAARRTGRPRGGAGQYTPRVGSRPCRVPGH